MPTLSAGTCGFDGTTAPLSAAAHVVPHRGCCHATLRNPGGCAKEPTYQPT